MIAPGSMIIDKDGTVTVILSVEKSGEWVDFALTVELQEERLNMRIVDIEIGSMWTFGNEWTITATWEDHWDVPKVLLGFDGNWAIILFSDTVIRCPSDLRVLDTIIVCSPESDA